MITIYKYPLQHHILMPQKSEILSVGLDPSGEMCLWAIIETNNADITYDFAIVGTGQKLPPDCIKRNFLGTIKNGGFMWHIFQIK